MQWPLPLLDLANIALMLIGALFFIRSVDANTREIYSEEKIRRYIMWSWVLFTASAVLGSPALVLYAGSGLLFTKVFLDFIDFE